MKYLLFLFLIVAEVAQSGTAESDKQDDITAAALEYYSQLDGIWEGEFESPELEGDYKGKVFRYKMRIAIDGDTLHFAEGHEGKWYNVRYEYKIIRKATNAIIYTHAQDTGWVETINLTVTLDSIDELDVVWSRIVNNFTSEEKSKVARSGSV